MPRARSRLLRAHRLVLLAPAFAVFGCAAKISAPPEPPVAVRLADESFAAEDYEGAIRDYRRYLAEVDQGEYAARAYYKAALAAYRLGDYAGTLATLDELQAKYRGADWVQVGALRGDAQRELGQPTAAIVAWDGAWRDANDIERPKLRTRISNLAVAIDNSDLRRARDEVKSKEVAALLDLEISKRKHPPIDEPLLADPRQDPGTRDASADKPQTVIDALRNVPAERGVAATPGYETGEGVRRGPNRHPIWRDSDSSTATAPSAAAGAAKSAPYDAGERVYLESAEGTGVPSQEAAVADAPGGLRKLDVRDEAPPPSAPVAPPRAVVAEQPDESARGETARLQRIQTVGDIPAAAPQEAQAPAAASEPSTPLIRLQKIDGPITSGDSGTR